MSYLLGVDTGGTYTDAVLLDSAATRVIAKAKALTTRDDLSLGIGRAVDAAIARAGIAPGDIRLVSLSTTLATNALVEGQGGRVALVFIGFDAADLTRAGLAEALGGDPVIVVPGGHGHAGQEIQPLDLDALKRAVEPLGAHVAGFAVASQFATRNPAHEMAARDLIRRETGRPVTCSHELSSGLNGPKRALTAVLNGRLIGMIDGLIGACQRHLAQTGIQAPLMVVRGDGALISAEMARERPIETILSGPAASIVGARWLTGETEALVSDIGGTTTDVALLRGGLPEIDPLGAQVGGWRTMVQAVAMRTTGLGGDSEVHLTEGLEGGLRLGPRRLVPVSLLAMEHGPMVHAALDRALQAFAVAEFDGRFVLPMGLGQPDGLAPREVALLGRIQAVMPLAQVISSRLDHAALDRLVARGLVMVSGLTPSDAAHVLGLQEGWDRQAAEKALALFGRRRNGRGERFAPDVAALAQAIVDQLTSQTAGCLLETAFAEDAGFAGHDPATLAAHALTRAGLAGGHRGVLSLTTRLALPVIGLGASARAYYPPVGAMLDCKVILPEHADVANAVGAVVGQVSQQITAHVSAQGEARFVAHLSDGAQIFPTAEAAMAAAELALSASVRARALAAGAEEVTLHVERAVKQAQVEGQLLFVEAEVTVTASGRPRVAHSAESA